jgi:hypothetical protein
MLQLGRRRAARLGAAAKKKRLDLMETNFTTVFCARLFLRLEWMTSIVEKFRSDEAVGGVGNGVCGHCTENFGCRLRRETPACARAEREKAAAEIKT